MKIIICCLAFVVGCFVTVFLSPDKTDPSLEALQTKTEIQDQQEKKDQQEKETDTKLSVKKMPFGKTTDGKEVTKFVFKNKNNIVVEMIDYGATVTSVQTPDRDGKFTNITLSCPTIEGYQKCGSYFGCTVGRYCNRIAKGEFKINGAASKLATNNGPNHLHGGAKGFDKQIWAAEPIQEKDKVGMRFQLKSPDGDEGYPGNLTTEVRYVLTNNDELIVEFNATTDKPTHVNLTNHNYWNLGGQTSGKILDYHLKIDADKYLPVDDTGIPTGKLVAVKDTPFDFTEFHPIGNRFDKVGAEPAGYDHCYALNGSLGKMHSAATVKDPKSGRVMTISTTLPGIQFYTGNFLDGSEGSGGFGQHNAFCLETQFFPDSPNQSQFPTTLLEPGKKFHHVTVHKFSVEKKTK